MILARKPSQSGSEEEHCLDFSSIFDPLERFLGGRKGNRITDSLNSLGFFRIYLGFIWDLFGISGTTLVYFRLNHRHTTLIRWVSEAFLGGFPRQLLLI